MSVDFMMWEFQKGLAFDGQATCEMLCNGIEVEGFKDIDVGAFLTRIATAYRTATRNHHGSQISFDGVGWKFQITWSKQHIHFTLYGVPSASAGDLFVLIADELGCWTYHPTSGELFAPEGTPTRTGNPREEFDASLRTALQLFPEKTVDDKKFTSVGEFNVGDRIGHPTFGSGTIFRFDQMQTGTLVVVDFDKVGRKGLLLGLANLMHS